MKKYFVMIGNVIGFSIILQVCAIIIGKIWWNENIIPKKFAQDNIIMTSVLTFSLRNNFVQHTLYEVIRNKMKGMYDLVAKYIIQK